MGPRIHDAGHQMSLADQAQFFPGLKKEDLPDGESWAVDKVQLNTHNGTHLDAPDHLASTRDGGRSACGLQRGR